MFGDLKSEDEKLAIALGMALNEIQKDKNQDDDEPGEKQAAGAKGKKLGTTSLIKLPYVIGTPEF